MNVLKFVLALFFLLPGAFIALLSATRFGFGVFGTLFCLLLGMIGLAVLVAMEPRHAKH